MLWIGSVITGLTICAVLFFLANGRDKAEKENSRYDREELSGSTLRIIAFLLFFLLAAYTFVASIRFVNAGFVDVVYEFGAIIGQRSEGLQIIAPWQNVQEWEIRVQRIRPETNCDTGAVNAKDKTPTLVPECLETFSAETQDVFVRVTLNLEVTADAIQSLARTVGPSYINTLVRPRLHQILKDTTVKYHSVDIAPNRDEIRVTVLERLKGELAPWSIRVVDLLIDNLDFRKEFKDAIEAKQMATQEALRQKELIAAREAEAKQKAAEAKGNADKLRIEAEGQAQANELISKSLTPALIQFQAVQKLGPDIKIALIPSGQGIIIDPATLLGQTAPAANR